MVSKSPRGGESFVCRYAFLCAGGGGSGDRGSVGGWRFGRGVCALLVQDPGKFDSVRSITKNE